MLRRKFNREELAERRASLEYPVHSTEISRKREIPYDPGILEAIQMAHQQTDTTDSDRVGEWKYCLREIRRYYRGLVITRQRRRRKSVAVLALYELGIFSREELAFIFGVKEETIRFHIGYARGKYWATKDDKDEAA